MFGNCPETSLVRAPGTIRSVGIPTRDRPTELKRGLNSLINHCKEHNRSPRIIIIDDSEQQQYLDENRRFIEAVKGNLDNIAIIYINRNQILKLIESLAKVSAVPYEIVFFCLAGVDGVLSRLGASRNFFVLATQGYFSLLLDDDVLSDPYTLRDQTASSEAMRSTIRPSKFFPNRYELLQAIEPSKESLLGLHEMFLGHAIEDCKLNLGVNRKLVVHGNPTSASRIRATGMGVAGTITTDKPTLQFYRSMATKDYDHLEEDDFKRILEAGEAIRVAGQLEISANALPSAYCLGLDNTSRTPPWFPVLRSQDLVFSSLLSLTSPSSLICDMPWAVLHDRPGERKFTSHLLSERFCQISVCELLSYCLYIIASRNGRSSIPELGCSLVSIATGEAYIFDNWAKTQLKNLKINRIRRLRKLEQEYFGRPAFIQKEIQQTIQLAISNNVHLAISDIPRYLGEPLQVFRGLILLFGQLMIGWSEISAGFSEACEASGLADLGL